MEDNHIRIERYIVGNGPNFSIPSAFTATFSTGLCYLRENSPGIRLQVIVIAFQLQRLENNCAYALKSSSCRLPSLDNHCFQQLSIIYNFY